MVFSSSSEMRRARFGIALDELDLVVLLERLGEPEADVAAARDHQAPHRCSSFAHLAHDAAEIVARRDEEDLVALLDHGVAAGRDAAAGAIDRGDARLDVAHVLAQRAQLLPDQQAALMRAHGDQAHLAVGEIDHLQRARIVNQPRDVLGHQLLGADQDVDRQRLFGEELGAAGVFGRADARDLGRRAIQRVGDFAGDDVDLVAGGERDQDVGLGDAGGFEHRRVGGHCRRRCARRADPADRAACPRRCRPR